MNSLTPGTQIQAQPTSWQSPQTPGQSSGNRTLDFSYNASGVGFDYGSSWIGFEEENCLEELKAKVGLTQLHAGLINYELFEDVLLKKYDLSDCALDDCSKKFIVNLMIASLINVRMEIGQTGLKGCYNSNQSVGDCIKSLETLVKEGWDEESAKNLGGNLVFETQSLGVTTTLKYVHYSGMTYQGGTKSISEFRLKARDGYIRENSALFAHDGATEKISNALKKFSQQIINGYAPGLFPLQPQKFDLTGQKSVIEIEANRMFPGDEYKVCAERDRVQENMSQALKQMTSPDSGLVNIILTTPHAAGCLVDAQKEVLGKSLTAVDQNLPIPCYSACILYSLIKKEYGYHEKLIEAGIDPNALAFAVKACMNIHNLAKARQGTDSDIGQSPAEVEISSEELYEAHRQSLEDVNRVAIFQHSLECRALQDQLRHKFAFLPFSEFLSVLNQPEHLEALGIKPEYIDTGNR